MVVSRGFSAASAVCRRLSSVASGARGSSSARNASHLSSWVRVVSPDSWNVIYDEKRQFGHTVETKNEAGT